MAVFLSSMMTPLSAGSGPIYAMRGLFSGDIFVGAKVSRRRHYLVSATGMTEQ